MNIARFPRVALALALLLSMSASLAGFAPTALAQTASTHDLAKSAPAGSLLYMDLSLDTKSAQWTKATALIDAAGGSSSSTKSAVSMASDAGIAGGEAALVLTSFNALSKTASSVTSAVGGAIGTGNGSSSTSGLAGVLGTIAKGGMAQASPVATGEAAATGIALIVRPTDMTKALATLDKDFKASAAKASATPTETTYKDIKIQSYAPSDGTSGVALAQAGDVIVWGQTPADLKPIIDVIKSGAKALADVANFTKGAGALSGDQFAFGFINGQVAATDLIAAGGSSVGSMGDAVKELVGAGHDLAFQISATDAGIGIQTVTLPNGTMSSPAIATGTASNLNAASKVPADSLVFVNGYNLGKSAVMQALGLAVVSIFSGLSGDLSTPTATPTTDSMFNATAGFLGFNLKKDFLDQLTGKYVFALWSNGQPGGSQVDGVLASDAASPASLQVTVSGLGFLVQAVGQGKASVKTVTFGNSALSEATIGTGSTSTKVDFGVANDQFVLGIGDGASTYLTGTKSSLADSADFKAAFAGLPTEYDGISYINLAGLTKLSGSTASSIVPGATPVAGMSAVAAGASNVKSIATVSYKKDGLAYTSSLLVIAKK